MASIPARMVPVAVASAVIATLVLGCGTRAPEGAWPLPNGDLAGTRSAAGSAIDAENVAGLKARWRFRLTASPSFSGVFASTPVADRETVYVQDLRSNVFALDRTTGTLRWERRYHARNDGPERPGRRGRPGLWRHGHGGLRTRCRDGAGAVAEDSHEPRRAVHRHRPGRVERTRLPEHHRVSAVRQRCDLRARRR